MECGSQVLSLTSCVQFLRCTFHKDNWEEICASYRDWPRSRTVSHGPSSVGDKRKDMQKILIREERAWHLGNSKGDSNQAMYWTGNTPYSLFREQLPWGSQPGNKTTGTGCKSNTTPITAVSYLSPYRISSVRSFPKCILKYLQYFFKILLFLRHS